MSRQVSAKEKNFRQDLAIKLALVAIENYLSKQKSSHQNDGTYHGKLGKLRAQKLGLALKNDKIISDEATLLALFLAIVGKPRKKYLILHSVRFKHSSRLASLIAEQWITGESIMGRVEKNTTQSKVFSRWLLKESKSQDDNWKVLSDGEHADLFYRSSRSPLYITMYNKNRTPI